MRILGIDTTTDAVSAAVMADGRLAAQVYLHISKKHSATLLPALQNLIREADLTMQDMDAIAVTAGPGSFTGVRIGVATASAFSYVLGCPIYEVSTLDALIALQPQQIAVCALLDARRDQVYVKAQYGPHIVIQESAQSLEEVFEKLRGISPVIFTGDGAAAHKEEILAAVDGACIVPDAASYPAASGACLCAAGGLARERTYETVRPVYLRKPQAQRALEEKRKRATDAEGQCGYTSRDARGPGSDL